MTGHWTDTTLGAICDAGDGEVKTGPFGSQLHKSDYIDDGVPVVMPTNLDEGRVSVSGIARISNENVTRLSKHKLIPGDIVYGRRGDIGRQALITSREDGWLCGTGCLRITLGQGPVDSTFLHYYLRNEEVIGYISNQAVGATMPNLNTKILRSIPVRHPDLPTQKKIAGILSAYDDLIENNLRRIKILEEMAQSLYREWFVHFRFPGHEKIKFVDSPLGKIPEGWAVKKIKDFGEVVTGKTPSKKNEDFYGPGIPFVKTPDMHGQMFILGTNDSLTKTGAASQAKKTLPEGSICVSCIGTLGVVSITSGPCQTNQQINSVVLEEDHSREYLFFWLRSAKQKLENLGSNGATMGNVNKSKFEGMELVAPSPELLDQYHQLAQPIFEDIKLLLKKNNNLRETRDLLLPKLLN